MTHTSIVMVSYHTGPVLWPAIEAALQQNVPCELILVNNGNPQGVVSKLRALADRRANLTIISGHGNVGFARGCNLGAARASGEHILLLNPDCIAPPDAAEKLGAELANYQGAVLAGPFLANPDGSEQRGGRRAIMTPMNAFSESLNLHRFFSGDARFERVNYHERPMPDVTHEIPAISGSCMYLRRKDYLALGGMDEAYFLHMEDMDFCLRASKLGKIICVPSVRVTHVRSTSNAASAWVEWHKAKGFIRYFHTHFRGQYFPGFLTLVSAGVMARCAMKSAWLTMKDCIGGGIGKDKSARAANVLADIYERTEKTAHYSGRKFIVTGAAGQVGVCVTARLLAAQAEVIAAARQPAPFYHPHLHWKTIEGAMPADAPCDTLIHTAPLWVLPSLLHTLSAAPLTRIIAFGSCSVLCNLQDKSPAERDVALRLQQAEETVSEWCKTYGVALTLFRPTMIYGVGLDKNVTRIAWLARRFECVPVYLPAGGMRQPVHAEDLAEAVMQALDNRNTFGKVYELSGGEALTYRAMAERIMAQHQRPRILPVSFLPLLLTLAGKLLRKPHIHASLATRMNVDQAHDHDAATRDFGFAPRDFLKPLRAEKNKAA